MRRNGIFLSVFNRIEKQEDKKMYNSNDKYVAYVGTYTHGSSIGIHVYDLDVENGYMTERNVVPVNNASHIAKSNNGKYLYSIADEGVAVMKIGADGGLTPINEVGIDGMRGCFLSTDKAGKFLFVGGYHDGKVTVVHTHSDGRLGRVMDGIFHKGLGSVAERNFRPHISCVMPTPDNKYPLRRGQRRRPYQYRIRSIPRPASLKHGGYSPL